MTNRYIGTKAVRAEAMTRAEYNVFRGWTLPKDEDGADEGYLVEYLDGGKPNVPTHEGYVSWSPKAQFDAAYRERPEVPGIAPFEQRVVDERNELEEKLSRLLSFLQNKGDSVSDQENARMNIQVIAMGRYLEALNERIGAFMGR